MGQSRAAFERGFRLRAIQSDGLRTVMSDGLRTIAWVALLYELSWYEYHAVPREYEYFVLEYSVVAHV